MPPKTQKLTFAKDIYAKTELIAKKFNLHIDQLGELDAEIIDIFRGLNKSQDFVEHISKRLEIDYDTAAKITEDVNRDVFEVLKKYMQSEKTPTEITTGRNPILSSLEQAGDFTIEREAAATRGASLGDKNPVTPKDRTNLIAGLENPAPVVSRTASSGASFTNGTESRNEPLVEQLMRTSTAIPHEKVTREPEKEAPKPTVSASSSDPYREPVN